MKTFLKILAVTMAVFALLVWYGSTLPDVEPETQVAAPVWNQTVDIVEIEIEEPVDIEQGVSVGASVKGESIEEQHARWDRGEFTEDEIRELNADQAKKNVNVWK